ncbi:MAG: Txe/YoeB family addiction module toxin [Pyrinomonadaceae bacterium]
MQKSQSSKPKRAIVLSDVFRDDLRYWAENDRKLLLKVLDLIEATAREPFSGLGKPEPLKHKATGTWSRRINKEHRILYRVLDDRIEFLQARYHY